MDYTLRELECFSAVAEDLSFTRAAKRLHLAQPPLSRHIRTLEGKIGAPLFERHARKVALTAAGSLFYEETRGLLQQLLRAGEHARRAAQGETARLRLGFVSAVLSAELVEIFRSYRASQVGVQIQLQDMAPAEQLQRILQGRLEGGFVGMEPSDPPAGLQFIPWRKERLVCFLPTGHPLTASRILSVAELAGERFVAVGSGAAPAFSLYVHELCEQAGFRPRIILESPRAQAVAVMVAAGSGVALLPESLAALMGDAVVTVPLREGPTITHVFAHATGRSTQAMQAFIKTLPKKGR